MSNKAFLRPIKRPVFIANFAPVTSTNSRLETSATFVSPESSLRKEGIRYNFPKAGEAVAGGTSDGYCFRLVFAAGRLERTYEMVRAFLEEEGYGELPLPKDAEELRLFRQPPKLRHQLSLFGDNGYVHNPVKILFPVPAGQRGGLIVELYDEASPDHLLRFHRLK